MSDVTPARSALLEALREAHRAEGASRELRRRITERLAAERGRGRWSEALLRRALWLAPVGVLSAALGVMLLSPRVEHALEGAEVAVGPEPAALDPGGARAHATRQTPEELGARPCPRDEVPARSVIAPMETDFDSRRVGITVHLLEIKTRRCGLLMRRYLQYVPPSAKGKPNPAVWILLHDTHESAETLRTEDTRWYFDALAEREGFIVVYANAAPGLDTDPNVPNSGGWQTSERSSPHVDDDLYLERVVADVKERLGAAGSSSPIYLAGRVGGADMALAAAAYRPDLYSGVAAFMPLSFSESPREVRRLRLTRALFVFLGESPGTGGASARDVVERWAVALGMPRGSGRDNTKAVRAARPHVVQQLDFAVEASSGPAARLLVLERTTDPFPVPGAYALVDGKGAGMRGAEEAWRFLTGAEAGPEVVLGDPEIEQPELGFEDELMGPRPR